MQKIFWEGVKSCVLMFFSGKGFTAGILMGMGGGGVTEVASAGFWSGKRKFCKVEQDFF